MQYALEHFAIFVSAISGVLAARGKQVDLFGVIVLGVVTAFGGGTMRDLLLGDTPVVWMRDPYFLLNAVSGAIAAFLVTRLFVSLQRELLIADAFALALYTILGTRKALDYGMASAIAITIGVITGVSGGILRDILSGEIPLVFRPQIYLYATAALVGATVYIGLAWLSLGQQKNMLISTGVVLILRLIAIRWKVGLPVFQPGEADAETK
jgi:uncharacterized membrane protein YeiH